MRAAKGWEYRLRVRLSRAGRAATAANYAQLRKVLCLDALSMEDALASGTEHDSQPRAA